MTHGRARDWRRRRRWPRKLRAASRPEARSSISGALRGVRWRAGSREKAERDQLRAQRGRIREMDRVNAERLGGRDICCHVVDIDGAIGIDCKPLNQQCENARVRLDQLDLTRDENPVKPAQELEALESRRIGL